MGRGMVYFSSAMARESTMDKMSARKKKKIQGVPHVLSNEFFFKTALLGGTKLSSSRRFRYRRRRHRPSRSKVEKKRNDAKGKMLVMVSKDDREAEGGELPFVRRPRRPRSRSRCDVDGKTKSVPEGKKKHRKGLAEKMDTYSFFKPRHHPKSSGISSCGRSNGKSSWNVHVSLRLIPKVSFWGVNAHMP
jgi:hypothetical protein